MRETSQQKHLEGCTILKFYCALNDVKLSGGYEDFPKKLTWLCWKGFSLKSIPENFYLANLVVLELRNSSLQSVWKGTKFLPHLKILDLSHSHGLLRTLDLSGVPNLERLILKDCINIVEIDETIGDLAELVVLNLEDCKNLVQFPKSIIMLRHLQELTLSGCSKLILHENAAASNRLHSTDNDTKELGLLSKKSWRSIWSRLSPRNIQISTSFSLTSLPLSLQRLNLSYCNLSDLSSDLSILSSLKYLNLCGNPILSLPENMNSLTTLENLNLQDCAKLETLPELPPGLRSLVSLNCSSLKYAAELPYMRRLLRPVFWNCNELVEVQRLYNIKPLRSVDIEMIKDMCLYDFESIGDTQIEMTNCLTRTTRTGPIQGLYECGIFSIFLHGSTIPDWYNYKSKGKLLMTITVPSNLELKIRGLNLCVVYTKHPDRECIKMYYWSINLKVSNETKDLMWAYRPVTIGSPIKNVDILWLSHWPFGTDDLQGGEELCVSVDQGCEKLIKEFGVQLVYEQQNTCEGVQSKREDATVHQKVPYWSQDHVVGAVSVSAPMYQMWRGKYFLCNLRFDAYQNQYKWSQRNPDLLNFSYEPDGP